MAPTVKPPSQTQSSQKKTKVTKSKTVRLDGSGPSSSAPVKLKRLDPLTAFSKNLTSSAPDSNSVPSKSTLSRPRASKGKGKEKGISGSQTTTIDADDTLWVDRYEPRMEAELAVHVKKVDNVRQWLSEAFEGGPSGVFKKYRRILALTGPAGTGKTSTIRVLARELGFEILEWRNSVGEIPPDRGSRPTEFNSSYEGLFAKFEAFVTRASTCNNIFSEPSSSKSKISAQRRIVLLEDLPNILHQDTQTRFHDALLSLVNSPPSDPPVPVVIIVSDSGMRGADKDERISEGRSWGRDKNQVVDIRTVLPKELLSSVYVTEINFNPIAPTLLRKALQSMLNTHFADRGSTAPSKEVLDTIVESSNGDIRSAIMALQFACIVEMPGRKAAGRGKAMVMEAMTRREQSLDLFHLLGKVLYNKRKGDPPNSSASAKDLQKERDIDASLKSPAKLPPHLNFHERRTSRVNIDAIYADSPIDSSLFSLYIHQNFTQFCNDVEECSGVADWLSWIDCSGGEAWYQTNPHQFHLLSLGTLHSLPSPVQRRSQKYFKPEFFGHLQTEREAWDGVQVTRDWIVEKELAMDDSGWRACGWSKGDVILELGAVLRAQDLALPLTAKPPAIHRRFSRIDCSKNGTSSVRAQQLDENDGEATNSFGAIGELELLTAANREPDDSQGGWLDSDDIEEFQ